VNLENFQLFLPITKKVFLKSFSQDSPFNGDLEKFF